jgi:protein-tyrosine phosphatase
MPARILGRPLNFSFIDDYVAGSAGGLSKREVNWLRNEMKIDAILSMREAHLAKGWLDEIEYLNVPIKNHAVPTLDQLTGCVDYLLKQVSQGHMTVVHSSLGRGRTGTILASYICTRYSMDPVDSIQKIRAMRPGSVEKKQELAIFTYYLESKREKSRH